MELSNIAILVIFALIAIGGILYVIFTAKKPPAPNIVMTPKLTPEEQCRVNSAKLAKEARERFKTALGFLQAGNNLADSAKKAGYNSPDTFRRYLRREGYAVTGHPRTGYEYCANAKCMNVIPENGRAFQICSECERKAMSNVR